MIDTTRIFARILGPLFLVLGLAVITGRMRLEAIFANFIANPAQILIAGFLSLLLGLAIVATHRVWSSVASVFIGIFGWLMIARGAVLLFAPELIAQFGPPVLAHPNMPAIYSAIAILIGFWLAYVGYFSRAART